ncbi:MAG: ABC transporter permease [Methylococcaceae bacterium]
MHPKDLISLSYRSVIAHKLRSLLTTLGIIIGIASVVILTSIGEGIHRYVLNEFTQFGTNLIAVVPGKSNTFGTSGATISTVRPLSLLDAEAISRIDHVQEVAPLVQGNARIESDKKQRRASVFGVGAAVPTVWNVKVDIGRFLPQGEQLNPRAFAVLGSKLKTELFGSSNPLGQRVRVGQDRYRIIGVMETKGQMLGFDLDDSIYIPVAKSLELFDREGLMEIDLVYSAKTTAKKVERSLKRLLIARHGQEDFTLITQKQMLETLNSVLNILTLAVGALGGISLLVGTVGILTMMSLSVSERIFEIGLLRAIGATRTMIFQIFLNEALLLCLLGGFFGVLTGISLVKLIKFFIPELPIELVWTYIVIALIASLLIGLLAGILPALKAARFSPLEALRME